MKNDKITYSVHYVLLDVSESFQYSNHGALYKTDKDEVPTFIELIQFLEKQEKGDKKIAITACFPV